MKKQKVLKMLNKLKAKFLPTHWKILLGLLIVMSAVYVVFIQLWKLTSSEYLPSNVLDSEIKIPENREDWFERRKHGT